MILSTYIVMEVSSEVGMIVSNNRAGTSTVRFNTEGNRERDKQKYDSLTSETAEQRAVCIGVKRSTQSRILLIHRTNGQHTCVPRYLDSQTP